MRSKEYGGALGHAEETIGIGTHHGERNLMALGLHDKGTILIGGDQCGEPLLRRLAVADELEAQRAVAPLAERLGRDGSETGDREKGTAAPL